MYLYEAKRVFDIHYLNTNPAHALLLDTKFKTKYIADNELSFEERRLDVDKIVEIMKEKNVVAEQVYEIKLQKIKLDLNYLRSFKITSL